MVRANSQSCMFDIPCESPEIAAPFGVCAGSLQPAGGTAVLLRPIPRRHLYHQQRHEHHLITNGSIPSIPGDTRYHLYKSLQSSDCCHLTDIKTANNQPTRFMRLILEGVLVVICADTCTCCAWTCITTVLHPFVVNVAQTLAWGLPVPWRSERSKMLVMVHISETQTYYILLHLQNTGGANTDGSSAQPGSEASHCVHVHWERRRAAYLWYQHLVLIQFTLPVYHGAVPPWASSLSLAACTFKTRARARHS